MMNHCGKKIHQIDWTKPLMNGRGASTENGKIVYHGVYPIPGFENTTGHSCSISGKICYFNDYGLVFGIGGARKRTIWNVGQLEIEAKNRTKRAQATQSADPSYQKLATSHEVLKTIIVGNREDIIAINQRLAAIDEKLNRLLNSSKTSPVNMIPEASVGGHVL